MSGNSEWLDKMIRLYSGPLRLPRTITSAQRTIRLFMAYLSQPATRDALQETVARNYGGKEGAARMHRALQILDQVGVPSTHEALCRLVARAPMLSYVRVWAWHVRDEDILPERALPSQDVIDACVDTYHRWVEALSRQR